MSEPRFTRGPWFAKHDGHGAFSIETEDGWQICFVRDEHNAKAVAAAPELFAELKAAHQIIRNALNIMTPGQKVEWSLRNGREGVDGEGVTRANEREAVLAKALGEQS